MPRCSRSTWLPLPAPLRSPGLRCTTHPAPPSPLALPAASGRRPAPGRPPTGPRPGEPPVTPSIAADPELNVRVFTAGATSSLAAAGAWMEDLDPVDLGARNALLEAAEPGAAEELADAV